MATPDTGIKESDKTFYLALIGTFALVGVGIGGIFIGHWSETKDFLAILSPLVVMSWTFFFHAKLD